MIRILIFLVFVAALGLGFAWLADRPGDMVVRFGGYQYQVSLMVAAVAVTAIVATVMIGWWLVKAIWNSPYTISRYFRVRQRDRGYQALSTGVIAAGAGDAALARQMSRQAAKLIRSETEPLIALLDAQASLLEGDHDAAREKFERMLDDPETRLLGLRGLYLEAERLGDRSAAHHYAGRAADIAPQLDWAIDSTLEEKTADRDWDAALALVDAQKKTGQVDKAAINRKRAVLLTAKAEELIETDPGSARVAALEANQLAPDFVPAAIAAAKVMLRQNDIRKAARILEAVWKIEPHPAIADLYVHERSGDTARDRLTRARKLQSLRQNNVESSLAVARAALEAQEFKLARDEVEAAIRMQPREGAYLLLADIEEAETGDQGKVRQFLARALRAPRDPAWVADGFVSERWAPASPVTGKLDAFEWRVPMERVGPLIEADASQHPSLALPTRTVEAEQEAKQEVPSVAESDAAAAGPLEIVEEKSEIEAGSTNTPAAEEPVRMPDDPGVDPRQEQEQPERRFRLF